MRNIVLIFIFLCGFFALGYAADATFEFEGRYWFADLDANTRIVESGIGTDFDLKSDLGVNDEELPEGRFIWHTGQNSKIRLFYTKANYSGSQAISRSIEFEGKTYTAGTQVDSGFEIKYFGFGWIWQMINLIDKIKLGPIVELKGIMADISLKAPALGFSESEQLIGGLPTAGLSCEINPIEKLNIFAEASGIDAGDYGYFFDAEAGIKFIPLHNFSVSAGYRIIDFKAEHDPDYLKAKFKGPFVAASLRF